MDRSSSPKPCASGSRSVAFKPSTSSREAHGRMPIAKASIAACGMNCSTLKASPRWRRQKCWAKNIGRFTMSSGCIPHWTTSPPPSSADVVFWLIPLRSISQKTTHFPPTHPNHKTSRRAPSDSHKKWLKHRGQVSLRRDMGRMLCMDMILDRTTLLLTSRT